MPVHKKNSPDCAPKFNEINKVVIYECANKMVDKILLFMHSTFALFPHTAVSSKGWLQWRSFIAHTSNPAPIIYINWLWCIYLCNPGMIGWGLSHHAPQILPFCVYLLNKKGQIMAWHRTASVVGVTKAPSVNYTLWQMFDLEKNLLNSSNHIHNWQASPQLSCSNTCQIRTWYSVAWNITERRKFVKYSPSLNQFLPNPTKRQCWCRPATRHPITGLHWFKSKYLDGTDTRN